MDGNVRTEDDPINDENRGTADRDAESGRGGTPDANRKGGETRRQEESGSQGGSGGGNVADQANYMGKELDEGQGGSGQNPGKRGGGSGGGGGGGTEGDRHGG